MLAFCTLTTFASVVRVLAMQHISQPAWLRPIQFHIRLFHIEVFINQKSVVFLIIDNSTQVHHILAKFHGSEESQGSNCSRQHSDYYNDDHHSWYRFVLATNLQK